MNNLAIKKILIISLIFLSGCQLTASQLEQKSDAVNSSTPSVTSDECPEQPEVVLEDKNVQAIALNNEKATLSGIAKKNQSLGYTFEAKSGQKFNYQTDEDICLWIYTPENQLLSSKNLSVDGNYIIQVSAPKGSKTFDLEISLETPTSNASSTIPTSSIKDDLTKEQALEIVKGWYRAKSKIFGYPFDKRLVAQYAMGQLYYETLEKDGGGSVGWLKRNNCYYTYDFSNINNVWLFSTSGTRPLLKIQVSEKLQLHGPSSSGCSNRPRYYQKNVSYWFEKDNGAWKIYYYEVE